MTDNVLSTINSLCSSKDRLVLPLPIGHDFYILIYLFISEEEKQYSSIDDQTKNAEKCQVDAAEIEYLEREQCRIFIFIRYIIYYILY